MTQEAQNPPPARVANPTPAQLLPATAAPDNVEYHIVETPHQNETPSMRKWLLRTSVALLSLTIGVTASLGVRSLLQPRAIQPACPPPKVETPLPDVVNQPPAEYPDESNLSPSQIEHFIDNHPKANLEKLWKRLGRNAKSETYGHDFTLCVACNAESFEYDLDGEPGDETILKISETFGECFRYLIFKYEGITDRKWKVIGDVDQWGKYKDSRHMVVLGDGRPLLLIEGQGASGSGVSLFINQLLLVSPGGTKEILSFPASGRQSDAEGYRDFTGQVVSYSIRQQRIEVTLRFHVSYGVYSSGETEELFSKTQTAVYSGSINSLTLQRSRSTISEREIEHIYNIDSMTENDFLKYNYDELLNLANHGNQKQKSWLKNDLQTFRNSDEKRMLLGALRK